MSYPTILPMSARVLEEVSHERVAQRAKWGEQNHPDGTSESKYGVEREIYRDRCDYRHTIGSGSWLDILLEEVYEAASEADPAALRAELIQVAAVAVAWVEAIDRQAKS